MIDRIKATIKYRSYRRAMRRQFEPRPEFLKTARRAFLAEVAKRRVAPYAPHLGWRGVYSRSLQYAGAIVLVAIISTSGLVAFADINNVQPTHPLYHFKRISEHVRLQMTPKERQHGLYVEFAQRRAAEVLAMQQAANNETADVRAEHEAQIKKIKKDFQKNIEALEEEPAVEVSLSPASVRGLCETKEKIEQDGGFEYSSGKMIAFDRQCDTLLHPEAMGVATTTLLTSDGSDNSDSIGMPQKSSEVDDQDNAKESKNNAHRGKKPELE